MVCVVLGEALPESKDGSLIPKRSYRPDNDTYFNIKDRPIDATDAY
jgi:hypothetical protein